MCLDPDPIVPENPCQPSPCGLYSICRAVNGHAVCSCVPNYVGAPPNCRPECMSSSECSQDKSCINERCKDPCPGTCGHNALCRVVNHNPICSCSPGYSGDPFVRCLPQESKKTQSHHFIKQKLALACISHFNPYTTSPLYVILYNSKYLSFLYVQYYVAFIVVHAVIIFGVFGKCRATYCKRSHRSVCALAMRTQLAVQGVG